jgi:uncharacterized membrane protein
MKQKRLTLLALALLTLLATTAVLDAAPAQYAMDWWTVDGGGGTVSGGSYSLSGTVGQSDAGSALEGGTYRLVGGYWSGIGAVGHYELYLPSVIRNY